MKMIGSQPQMLGEVIRQMRHRRTAGQFRLVELHLRAARPRRNRFPSSDNGPGCRSKDRVGRLGFGDQLRAQFARQFFEKSRANVVIIQRRDKMRLDTHLQERLKRRLHRDDHGLADDRWQQMLVLSQRRPGGHDHRRLAFVTVLQAATGLVSRHTTADFVSRSRLCVGHLVPASRCWSW